jgi:DNA-binding HxlR family transcriptional regulator
VESYRQFCPLSKAAEIVCERWTPLILRELALGSTRFNEVLRGNPGLSPSMLSQRLKSLEREGVVRAEGASRQERRYQLTEAGRELEPVLTSLAIWGHRWSRTDYRDEDLDPGYLIIDIERTIRERPSRISRRAVVELELRRGSGEIDHFWLVVEPETGLEICHVFPGFDIDATIETDLRTLTMIWMGDLDWPGAMDRELVRVSGQRSVTRQIPRWIGQNDLASVQRAGTPGA